MSSNDKRQQKFIAPIRSSVERVEYEKFLINTPFSSSTTDEEKYSIFKFRRQIEQQRERKRKRTEYARKKYIQDKLKRKFLGLVQPSDEFVVKQPPKKRLETCRAAGPNQVLSTRFPAKQFCEAEESTSNGRLWFERVVRPMPELRESLSREELPAENVARIQKTSMASSRKKMRPNQDDVEALEKQKRQLRCINRCCSHGDTLTQAIELACTYYGVKYKPNREVCLTCFSKCLRHFKHLEMKWKKNQCIMDTKFPSYDSHFVIDDSSSDEEQQQQQLQEPMPSTSRKNLPPDQDTKDAVSSLIECYFHKNKHLIDNQIKLCDEYIKKGISQCLNDADELDKMAFDLENEMKSLKKDVYDQYLPVRIELQPVDIDELEENIKDEEKVNTLVMEVETLKGVNKLELDTSDKEDVVTIDRTICVVPANIPVEGPLVYPFLKTGQTVFAKEFTLIKPWRRCKIKSVINEDYVHVWFENNEKLLTTNEVAFLKLNPVRFPVGCRVIAKFKNPNSNHAEKFYAGIIAEPPKMLNNFRYLIFFDHGFAQYHQHCDIRLTARRNNMNQVHKIVHQISSEFIKNYLEKYPDQEMVKLSNQHSVRANFQNQWQMAKVLKVDASLVKLYFTNFKHKEWMYRGSSRIYNIFEKQSKYEKDNQLRQPELAYLNKPFVEFTSVEEEPVPHIILSKSVARKSTSKNSTSLGEETQKCNKNKINASEVVNLFLPKSVPEPLKYISHKCSPSCIEWTAYDYNRTRHINMLTIPLHFGFVRYLTLLDNSNKCIIYKAPCGVNIRNIKQMQEYLFITGSTMTIDLFDFNSWVRPFVEFKNRKYVKFLKDISESKEFKEIPCVNTINNLLPPRMDYMTTRQPMPGVNINVESDFLCGCDCTDNCQDKSKCACWQMTIDGQKILPNIYKDPNIGYSYRRLPERVLTGIYECNKTCKCSSSCLNRVVQNPLSQKLQLFMTEKKGWGVQCLNDIPQGSFICVYVGYLLTETDANEGGKNYGDEYLAELDYIEVVEKIKEGFESEVPNSDHENESKSSDEYLPSTSDGKRSDISSRLRKRKKLKTKKDDKRVQALSKLNAHVMKNTIPPKSMREYFGNNENVYIMDAKTSGNIGRYLNHSCSPNTFVQNVFVDTHDLRFPWISFFALHYIPAGTELTWNYSYDVGSVPGKRLKCHCESDICKGRLL